MHDGPVVAPGSPLRVALLFSGNAFGLALQPFIEATLSFNGKTPSENGDNYLAINYGDPTAADANASH